uniref:Mediator of RNA polymerase II transcription subunit 28 n=1 Tax=Angiostrongylus cantonensis TaxID=6313 RepID=A0A0K0D0Q9_ANGCA
MTRGEKEIGYNITLNVGFDVVCGTEAATLDSDLKRRMAIEKCGHPDVDEVVLRELEKPLDYEVETAEEFQRKMARVRHLMAELLLRTILNEWAAQQEMAEQEKEVMARIRDASNARKMLRDVLIESKKKAEDAMLDRKNRYEVDESPLNYYSTTVTITPITLLL